MFQVQICDGKASLVNGKEGGTPLNQEEYNRLVLIFNDEWGLLPKYGLGWIFHRMETTM